MITGEVYNRNIGDGDASAVMNMNAECSRMLRYFESDHRVMEHILLIPMYQRFYYDVVSTKILAVVVR
jgi:hypothetical protein